MIFIIWTCWGWLFHHVKVEKVEYFSPPEINLDNLKSQDKPNQPHITGVCMEKMAGLIKLSPILTSGHP